MNTRIVTVVRLVDKNKAKLAFLLPFIAAVATAAASWIVSGEFNATEIRAAAGGTVLALAGALGAYIGKPGQAEIADSRR